MGKNKDLREQVEQFDETWVMQGIASGIDLASTESDKLTRGQQWKVWLDSGEKTAIDLIRELEKAPGKPPPGEAIGNVEVPYYKPGPVQWAAHNSPESFVLVAGGWRAGKSKWLAAQLLPYMFKDFAHVWIVANDYKLGRAEWGYIHMWLKWLNVPLAKPVSKPKEGSYEIETAWHAKLETMTGKDDDKIEMANLDAAGIAEAGQADKSLFNKVQGRVFQKRGPIYISGSMTEAQPWYVNNLERYQNGDEFGDWHSYSIPSFDNEAVFPLGENEEILQKMKRNLPADEYARKVLAQPAPPEGLVFKDFDSKKHVVPIHMVESSEEQMVAAMREAYSPFYNNDALFKPIPQMGDAFTVKSWAVPEYCDIEVAIDPGFDPGRYAVLACVRTKDTVLVIDEVYEAEKTGAQVIQICMEREWWPRVKRGTIDIAGKQHQADTSQIEVWQKEAGFRPLTRFIPIPDGIKRYHEFLYDPKNGRPRLYIDPQCVNLIAEHRNYRYPKNREEGNLRILPIDRHNHAIKALTYYLVQWFKFSDTTGGTTSRRYVKDQAQNVNSSDWMFQDGEGWNERAYRERRTIYQEV
jgi:hypothetical protein